LTARAQTRSRAARTGRSSLEVFDRTIARQLAWNVANALAWSSPLHPSSSLQRVGSSSASGMCRGSAGALPRPWPAEPAERLDDGGGRAAVLGELSSVGFARGPDFLTDCGLVEWDVARSSGVALRRASATPVASTNNKKTSLNDALRMARARSRAAFSGDQLPVGIAGRDLPGKRPYVGDAGDGIRAAVDHIAVTIARSRYELRHKAERDLRYFAT
jgi:hypothetical protein